MTDFLFREVSSPAWVWYLLLAIAVAEIVAIQHVRSLSRKNFDKIAAIALAAIEELQNRDCRK